jgi:hypothetical protein
VVLDHLGGQRSIEKEALLMITKLLPGARIVGRRVIVGNILSRNANEVYEFSSTEASFGIQVDVTGGIR